MWSISNVKFYDKARTTLAKRFRLPKQAYLQPHLKAFVQTLRIAEVLRYNKESVNMGTAIIPYDGKLFANEPYNGSVTKLLTCGWFMEIAGTEYMLELHQPGNTGFCGYSNSEVFKLHTDTWSVQFRLTKQELYAVDYANGDLYRYMNQYVLLGEFDPQGDLNDLEVNATMFTLLSADLEPIPSKGV